MKDAAERVFDAGTFVNLLPFSSVNFLLTICKPEHAAEQRNIWRHHDMEIIPSLLPPAPDCNILQQSMNRVHTFMATEGRLTARSREVSKTTNNWNWMLYWSYRSEIWQASKQRCCRCVCQMSEWLEKSKTEYSRFETSWDLAVWRSPAYVGSLTKSKSLVISPKVW